MASRSLNRVILIGNLTRDPELKYTPAGTAVCSFGVATNRSWTTADGQTKEDTQYHRIVAWQKLAELCGKLLTKGRKIYLEGRLTYRTFTGKDEIQKTIAEIVLDDFIVFSDGRKSGSFEDSKISETPSEKDFSHSEEDFGTTENDTESSQSSRKEDVNPDDIPF
ncbi:MAG: single-stranded DNA-binding protein [Candidatus Roizmanbacteria bacterium]